MIGLRMFPGSPNPIYNILFPHIRTISLKQNLVGVLIGQLPYNMLLAKAGQMISKIHNRSDIIDVTTTLELIAVAVLFALPMLSNKSSRKR